MLIIVLLLIASGLAIVSGEKDHSIAKRNSILITVAGIILIIISFIDWLR